MAHSVPFLLCSDGHPVNNSRVESLLEQLVNTKVKAYVVSSEMTNQQWEDAVNEGRSSW